MQSTITATVTEGVTGENGNDDDDDDIVTWDIYG